MVVSLVLNPLSVVYASAPTIKPPTINAPTVNVPTTVPLSKLEAPARVQEVKPMSLEQFASVSAESSGNSVTPGVTPALPQNPSITAPISINQPAPATQSADENKFSLDKINGIKYPAGSKILVLITC